MKPFMIAVFSALICALGLTPDPGIAKPPVPVYDVVIAGGTVYDGSGKPGRKMDIGVVGDRIVAIGKVNAKNAKATIDARGKAVAPGFINMLSWANESLIVDGRGMSDLKQGVTLEVFGEGWSMGPYSPAMKAELTKQQGDIKYGIVWDSLGGYLDHMAAKGVSPNIASFVGAATVRMYEIGAANRKATPAELARMQDLVRAAMREGAMGVGSSLIYAPGNYADTDELIALSKAAAPFGGRYISHMRSEAENVEGAVDELIQIAREAKIGAEIYHMKLGGQSNWGKFDAVASKIAKAQRSGLDITANMYPYIAGATGLDASMPPWVQADGLDAWIARLKDPKIRARVIGEMNKKGEGWENLMFAAGDSKNLLFLGFKSPKLRPLIGKTLADVSAMRGTSPADTAIDLVLEDGSRVETAYFLMSEDNVRKTLQLPYVSFGSDAEAAAPEGVFLSQSTHPRGYGSFARVLGRYVRDEKLITLTAAIRRLTSLPAKNLKLKERGTLKQGYFADIVVFDPATIADKATYAEPMQYAVGVSDVLVNGTPVIKGGNHTGATPGVVVRGPGWSGWDNQK
jgi:N-acyl-D-amino-acid deacylase